ncbi:AAA family ATPase [Flavobacterium hungaricum]|uniref:Endonuclease GajA/Old nuclease/RecF-like AAA domain-containing protein n=1 Tax=Flavobacterium hungaricum TaxID=2082725 RepID=A0ABR9TDQ8_9FLAO|nr:AAA family ATPase [Flavobacterium hungaricum]MBE8723400.1 hypothetical protein [Flavobacterium hungaricum]
MKICYIWVEKFRNFKNQGFNFSTSEKFEYDSINHLLFKNDLKPLPVDFFGKRIVDVTGFIGENGTGKSNALELVCKILKGGKSSLKNHFFIITKEKENYYCYYKPTILFNPSVNFDLNFVQYEKDIDPLKIIFTSNVSDGRDYNFDKKIIDLSKNKNSLTKSRLFSMIEKVDSEFKIQMNFINSELFTVLNIKSPNKIQIKSNLWSAARNTFSEKQLFGNYYEDYRGFINTFRSRINDIKVNNKLYYILVYSLYQETLKQLNRLEKNEKDKYIEEFGRITDFYKNSTTDEMIHDMLLWMEYIAEKIEFRVKQNYSDEKADTFVFKEHLRTLIDIKNLIQEIEIDNDNEGRGARFSETFIFDFNPQNSRLVEKLAIFVENSRMFEISWLGISSGHKAYINIFASLSNELIGSKKSNLLLCIDEGDLYLHPRWQTEFLDRLLTFLPQIFGGKIQIILTSHSPFLLSDLPKQSINIFKDQQEYPVLNGNELEHETFAGNIYKLYEEPFFLGNQRLSLFASKKINYLIKNISANEELTSEELSHYIELIGDDIIRHHLKKRLNYD